MSTVLPIREAETIREELSDLREYLEGLPAEIISSGAFDAYLRRLDALNRELAACLLYKTYVEPAGLTAPSAESLYPAIEHRLDTLEQQHKKSADRYSFLTTGALLATALGAAMSILTSIVDIALPANASQLVVVLLALLLLALRPTDRARKEEQLASYFKALRNELRNLITSTTGSGTTSDASERSARAIETLIRDIQLQASG